MQCFSQEFAMKRLMAQKVVMLQHMHEDGSLQPANNATLYIKQQFLKPKNMLFNGVESLFSQTPNPRSSCVYL